MYYRSLIDTLPENRRQQSKETGKQKVWNQRGWDYLKKCKYSWQRPRPKHQKGNPHEQQEFKQNFIKKLKAWKDKEPQSKVDVWSFDE